MATDLGIPPWDRLARLAPPETSEADLQAAAERWAVTADLYAAAGDLWEEFALSIDTSPDTVDPDAPKTVQSVSQDGVSVTYATDALAGNNQSTRIAQYQQAMNKVRLLRSRSKPHSPLMHDRRYNPWTGQRPDEEIEDVTIQVEL